MKFSTIKGWFLYQIPSNKKNDFDMDIRRINLVRAKVTAVFFLIKDLIIFPSFLIAKKSILHDYPNYLYIVLYLLMITTMSFFLVLFYQHKRLLESRRNYTISIIFFTVFLQSWCAVFSLFDQLESGQIVVYIISALCIAIFPVFYTHTLFFIYLPIHIAFLILLPQFQSSADRIFENAKNSTVAIVVSLVISHNLFRSKKEDYMNKITIEEKNNDLNELNHRLMKANKQLERLSGTDSLTGLLNRRKFDDTITQAWVLSKQNSLPISVIMLDIDSFKQYNDNYGHLTGDNCIIKIAETISNMLRDSTDYAARYGGDEFILLLTDTDAAQAYGIAEKLRTMVEEMQISFNDSEREFVTVSLGVCSTVPGNDSSITELITTADHALYQAKSQRKNITVIYRL